MRAAAHSGSAPGGTRLLTPVPAAYPGGNVWSIALDASDWHRAYIVDGSARVWRTTDAGNPQAAGVRSPVTYLSASLLGFDPGYHNLPIVVVANPSSPSGMAVVVGGRIGLFVTYNPNSGASTKWTRLGTEFPNVLVRQMVYDRNDDVLVAATYGRGVWTIPHWMKGPCNTYACDPTVTWLDFNWGGVQSGCWIILTARSLKQSRMLTDRL